MNAETLAAPLAPSFPNVPADGRTGAEAPSPPPEPAADEPRVRSPSAVKLDDPTEAPDVPLPATWAGHLVAGNPSATWATNGRTLLLSAALASTFGVALGLRGGLRTVMVGAAGAPSGILAVALLAVPALAIVLALADAPVDAPLLARATSRSAAKAGLVLAGLAPAAALFVVTVEDAITVTLFGFGGLLFAGAIGARSLARDLGPALLAGSPRTRAATGFAVPAFLFFASVLAARIWWIALPFLTKVPS